MPESPPTRYAKASDGTHLAYQVVGDGPLDLVYLPTWVSHVEWAWEEPSYAHLLRRLGSFCRLIWFDKRGSGLSDRATILPTLENQMEDVMAVLDAAGSTHAALFGMGDGAVPCTVFAAAHPERVTGLIAAATRPCFLAQPDYPWGSTPGEFDVWASIVERDWICLQDHPEDVAILAPSKADDARWRSWFAQYCRLAASPSAAIEWLRVISLQDMRSVLPTLTVPTLLIYRTNDPIAPPVHGRYIADRVQSATYVELPGDDHLINAGDVDAIADEIQHFLTGARGRPSVDRVLATVLFTDIVGSTHRAAELGDERWREILDAHDALIRRQLDRFRGREVKNMGDGFLATFDGPARAIQCAIAVRDGAGALGLQVRAGLHTGEVEVRGDDIGGIAVHTGARVAGLARDGEVLVSSTVKDLVAGSGIRFDHRGEHEMKGVPGTWKLFAVAG